MFFPFHFVLYHHELQAILSKALFWGNVTNAEAGTVSGSPVLDAVLSSHCFHHARPRLCIPPSLGAPPPTAPCALWDSLLPWIAFPGPGGAPPVLGEGSAQDQARLVVHRTPGTQGCSR